MKKFYLFIVTVFLFHSYSYSQTVADTTQHKVVGVIKFYPLQILGGEVRFSFERPIKHNMSLDFGISYVFEANSFEEGYLAPGEIQDGLTYTCVGLVLRNGLKFYKSKKEHSGFYINPLVLLKYYKAKDFNENFYAVGLQVYFGYKIFSKNRFVFDGYAGLGLKQIFDFTDYGTNLFITTVVAPQLGFSIGYKFYKK